MPYEVEFLPVGDGAKSGDAIVLRYHDGNAWRVMIVDGGYEDTGEKICEHIRRWYGVKVVDYVVSSHPDKDHLSGLRVVLRQMRVRELWLHIPFLHAESIMPLFKSRRWQLDNLKDVLRRAYPHVEEVLELALAQDTKIDLPFQGARIGAFTVLSPTIEMYEGLLPQFRDTPAPDQNLLQLLGHWLQGVGRRTTQVIRNIVPEDWTTESLREGGTTAAENESSVVLYGDLGPGGILLTADAGLRALETAANYADLQGLVLGENLSLFQVPHHGSRNNSSSSMLNRIIGQPVPPGSKRRTHCIISAGAEDKTHPRQVVVDALIRRGLNPVVTRAATKRYWKDMPARKDWVAVEPLKLKSVVEAYD
jgi:beta-lactamase superfamily II metal-dependent hydrolase